MLRIISSPKIRHNNKREEAKSIRKFKEKRYWQQGGGEIIGFLCTLPVIIFILVLFVSIVQIGSVKERLEYTAYLACRQAVVATDTNDNGSSMDEAKKIAKKTAEKDLKKSKLKYKNLEVTLNLVDKKSSSSEFDTVVGTSDLSSSNKSDLKWEKGNYCQCIVSVDIEAVTPFLSGTRSASIVMMIEKPAEEGTDYPWFENIG